MSKEENINKEQEQGSEEQVKDTQTEVPVDHLQEEIEMLRVENEQLKLALDNAKDQVLRKAAEFDNLRRRTQKEKIQYFDDAKIEAVKKILPIYDDLERSLSAVDQDTDKNRQGPLTEGVKMVRNKFKQVLEQYGVERIDQTGVPFDVEVHDAMLRQPSPDEETDSDIVLQVLESGYKMGDKIIRHAKVIVSE